MVFPSGNATATIADEKQGDRTQASYGTPYQEDLLREIIPWRVDTNGHDTGVMSNSLYHFSQKLFKE
jgi:hypothetical protein